MSNNQEEVKIDLEINNTSRAEMLNTELLLKTINDDAIGVIVSFLIYKRPIDFIQHSTALLYKSILEETIEQGEQFEVDKIYLCPLYRYARWSNKALCIAFKVEKITNCYISVRQITTETNYALNDLPTKKLLKTNVNNGSRYFDIKKKAHIIDFVKYHSFEATISTDNCYSFDKEAHFRYMLNFSAKKDLIVGKYWDLIDFQQKNKKDEVILISWY